MSLWCVRLHWQHHVVYPAGVCQSGCKLLREERETNIKKWLIYAGCVCAGCWVWWRVVSWTVTNNNRPPPAAPFCLLSLWWHHSPWCWWWWLVTGLAGVHCNAVTKPRKFPVLLQVKWGPGRTVWSGWDRQTEPGWVIIMTNINIQSWISLPHTLTTSLSHYLSVKCNNWECRLCCEMLQS